MKRLILVLVLLGTPACHPPVTLVTPTGAAAYQADQVVLRLTEASDLVKANTGTQPGNISYRDAFTIIEWISGDAKATPPTTGLVQLVQTQAGQGWKAAAKAGWTAWIRPLFVQYPTLAPYAAIIDGLLEIR